MLSVAVSAQNIQVKGTVKDAGTGEGVPFAALQVKGTMQGTSTDATGAFTFNVPSNAVLIFSSIGYHSIEVEVAGKSVVDVTLEPDTETLEETIVVAYGTATKSSFTGSAAMVKSETIEKRVSTNVTSALAATTPGVQVISSNGDPASGGSTIRIRGIGSMSASNDPLYIVDGVPYNGGINNINPQDVESMSVLKDAAAAAIYGARGANGVVLITTKRASTGNQPNVKFDARFGSNSRLIPNYDVITDPAEYYETWYKYMYYSQIYAGKSQAAAYEYANKNLFDADNGGLGYQVYTVPEGQNLIGTNFKINPNAVLGYDDGTYYYTPDNWYDETFHSSFRQEYNASVSGNKEGLSYYGSVGYLNDGGIISNSNYKRYTARINADYQAKSWLKVTTSMSFTHSDSQSADYSGDSWGSSGNVFYIANTIAPIYPLYVRKSGTHEIMEQYGYKVYDANQTNFKRAAIVGNAVRDNEMNRNRSFVDSFNGKWGVVFSPVQGLDITANFSALSYNSRSNSLYSPFGSNSATDGYVSVGSSRNMNINQQYLATYKTDFGGSNHHFDVLAGYESYLRRSYSLSAGNDHLFNPFIGELNNAKGKKNLSASSSSDAYMTEGYLSRVQYDYAGKYFLSGSFRRDASSNFAAGHRWGNFGSVGMAWLISQEGFMSNATWVDMLKLKVSYGAQGNDSIGSYRYTDQYTTSYNEETGEYSLSLNRKGNENITWESSNAYNASFDFELFHGKLNGSIEGFDRITTNLLYSKDVPLSSTNPTGVVPTNVGSISNVGVEATLDGNIIATKNVAWDWNLNLTHYKNTILELDSSVGEEGIKGSNSIQKVGGSLYESYVRRYAGVNPETGKAQYYKKVLDADGNWTGEDEITEVFTEASQYECGTTLPKIYGGFGTSLSVYGFDFTVQCGFQLGGKYYDGQYQSFMMTSSPAGQNIHKDILNAWTPDNKDSNIPRLDGDQTVGQTAVDRFFISSNYLSIENVSLGYTFPKNICQKLQIGSMRVFVSSENLAVFSCRQGVDPRFSMGIGSFTSGSGLNSNKYSSSRNITGGITLSF